MKLTIVLTCFRTLTLPPLTTLVTPANNGNKLSEGSTHPNAGFFSISIS